MMGFSIVGRREAVQAAMDQVVEFLGATVVSNRDIVVGGVRLLLPLIAVVEDGRLFMWIDVTSGDDDDLDGGRDRMVFEGRDGGTSRRLAIDENGLVDPDWFLLQIAEEVRGLGS